MATSIGYLPGLPTTAPQSAHSVIDRILDSAERLGRFPHLGHAGRRSGTFEWVVTGLPYIIVYRIDSDDDLIDVIAVVHGAQDREREQPG